MTRHYENTPNLIVSCWSPKGGVGTSVVAALLALSLARTANTVLIDSAGDQSAIFGLSPSEVGFTQWSNGGDAVPVAGLARLATSVAPRLQLVPAGALGPAANSAGVDIARRIRAAFPDSWVVIDAGLVRNDTEPNAAVIQKSDISYLILKPCYLAAQRSLASGVRRDGIIYVNEPGRILKEQDITEVLGTKVVASVDHDPALARLVDAGRMNKKLPRSAKPLERLSDSLINREVKRVS